MQEKSLIKKNILQYLELKGISKYKFYQDTGVTRGVLDQNNGISEDNMLKFLAYFSDVNPEWFLTGEGSMLREYKTIKSVVAELGIDYTKEQTKPAPLVSQKAAAGFGSADFSISDRDVKAYYIIPKFKHLNVDFMIEITGSSMYPKYNSGDVVACTILRESSFIQWNKCHALATKEQGILIKRIKETEDKKGIIVLSDNKDYPPFTIPKKEIEGIALVVGVVRLE